MQTERDIASGGWSDPVASAIAWTYDNAPAGLDTLLHLGRRYVAPLLKPRLPMRRIAIGDGMSGTVLAIGESLTLDYVLQRLGGTRAAETLRGGATLFEIGSRLRSGTIEHDVVLVVVPRALAVPLGARCVRVPGLVSFVLPVASSLDTSLAEATTTVRRDARRVMEAGTIWTIATETAEFERFYDLFYTPLSCNASESLPYSAIAPCSGVSSGTAAP
jgi:hypothetical protein